MYLASALAMTVGALGLVVEANRRYAPEMYRPAYMETVADAFASGEGFAVFDLNINIRKLREEQWKRLSHTPALVVLGASQWQEATASLIPDRDYLNGHVHRDYYEDVLGMVELLVRYDRLPKDLVITIRDRLFTPVGERTDYLWLPGIPYYQAMARRLGVEPLGLMETQPLQRPRELLSLPMLFGNASRWHNAIEWPDPTAKQRHEALDVLNPDGSITWSENHQALFTQQRSEKVSLAHAELNRQSPPKIDPKGVEALDRLLSYLAIRNVKVHLAHPPFNPIYWERVQGSPYMDGLRQVEAVTRELAEKHKLALVGGFDPGGLGCTEEMFIDAEHSNASCLRPLLADISRSIDLPAKPAAPGNPTAEARRALRSKQTLAASGWMGGESMVERIDSVSVPPPMPVARSLPEQPKGDRYRFDVAPAAAVERVETPSAADDHTAEVMPGGGTRSAAVTPAPPMTRRAAPMPSTPLGQPVPSLSRRLAEKRSIARSRPARAAIRNSIPAKPMTAAVTPRLVWPGDRPGRSQ
jgi:hypothetical protein